MTIEARLSDGNIATIERDSRGLRIVASTYSWINPPEGKVFYLDPNCLQGGPITVREYSADESGNPTGLGQYVTSSRRINLYNEV